MKKFIALILALLMLLPSAAVVAEGTAPVPTFDELTVSTSTAFTGNFLSEAWGNNTSDADVRKLIHGYNLIEWNQEEGGFRFDPSVVSGASGIRSTSNDGRVYTISIYEDLCYSDGSPITAEDYVFSMLFTMSKGAAESGADRNAGSFIKGSLDFKQNRVPYVSGIRLIDEYTFTVAIDPDYEPFFYELGYLNYCPISPDLLYGGASVKDDGNGAYVIPNKALNAENYTKNIIKRNMTRPSKTSGPYVLKSYDGTTATFEINKYYKGNSVGKMPLIPTIRFTYIPSQQVIAALQDGKVDLVNKVTAEEMVDAGLELAQTEYYAAANYPRSGVSLASFCCERPAVDEAAVRRAMAMCMDKEAIVRDYCGEYGMAVSGYYGIGQWMYQMAVGVIPLPEDAPEGSSFDMSGILTYSFDTAAAAHDLQNAGWYMGKDGIRHKRNENGRDVKLELVLAYPETTEIGESLEKNWVSHLAEAGIKLTLKPMPFAELLKLYYSKDRDVDLIYLATDFTAVFDADTTVMPKGDRNYSGINSERLWNSANTLDKTEAGDLVGYVEHWIDFQEEYQKQLPAISVYSNVYFDFYTAYLREYDINTGSSWADAIIGAYLGEIRDDDAANAETPNP